MSKLVWGVGFNDKVAEKNLSKRYAELSANAAKEAVERTKIHFKEDLEPYKETMRDHFKQLGVEMDEKAIEKGAISMRDNLVKINKD